MKTSNLHYDDFWKLIGMQNHRIRLFASAARASFEKSLVRRGKNENSFSVDLPHHRSVQQACPLDEDRRGFEEISKLLGLAREMAKRDIIGCKRSVSTMSGGFSAR